MALQWALYELGESPRPLFLADEDPEFVRLASMDFPRLARSLLPLDFYTKVEMEEFGALE